jgi:TP901 family phage tail tape measure protein
MAVNLNVISQFDAKGLNRAQAELDKLASSTSSISTKLSGAAKVAGAGILVGAGAVAAGLFEIGSSFDEAFDNIRIGTGATGPALEGLQNDMKAVAGAVPASFGDAGKAITVFSQKLGLTGAPLQTLSSQVLELSRMTGTDLGGNLTAVTDVFNNFGVGAADQSGKLDLLFRASQASGVSVAELAGTMSGAGVVLREVGLDFNQSAGFLATLAKAGVDAGDVMPALSKSLASAAKQGKDASSVFTDTFNAIKGAPDDVAGAGIALDVFGAKAGPKLAALIREGKLSYEEMTAAISGGGDTILGASGDTQDFAEKLTMLKNRVFLAIEPIATKVFNAIGEAMDKLGPKIEQLVAWMTENGDTMKIVAGIIGGIMLVVLAAYTVSMIAAAAATIAATWPILAIIAVIVALVAGVIYAYRNFETFRNVIDAVWQGIQTAISFAWENVIKPIWDIIVFYITKILIPYYTFLFNVVKTVFEGIVSAVQSAWGFIQTAFNAIKSGIETVWGFFQTAKDIIGSVFTNIADAISGPFKTAFNFISDAWNNTVGKLSWSVPGWVPIIGGKKIEAPKLPRFAEGGIFNTGIGGGSGLAVLHDNEMILNPQQQKALFSGNGLGGGGPVYNINVNVSATADKAAVGQNIVEAIAAYERRSGDSWRAA